MHPTAVYDKNGELFTIKINGKNPKNIRDYFHLWNIRFESDCIIQTGKTLREEPRCFDVPTIDDFGINPEEYRELAKKTVCVLTRLASDILLEENSVYKDTFYNKIIYTKSCTFTDE